MPKHIMFICLCLLGLALAACGPQPRPVDPTVWIDEPLEFSWLSEGVHSVKVRASYSGEVGQIGLSFEHPGFAYAGYALPPGEPLDGDIYIANFQQVTDTQIKADLPFNFKRGNLTSGFNGEYTLRACIFTPEPQLEVIACTEIILYMPDCGPDEVPLGPDCIPAAVDETETPSAKEFVAVPVRDVNCRVGPSASLFEIDDTLFEGVEYMPLAQGPDAQWLMFRGPVTGNPCWAFVDNFDLLCNGEVANLAEAPACNLAVEDYPPLPTLTSTPTFTPEPEPTQTPKPSTPECSDGKDNDGDGRTDYNPTGRGDPQCSSPDDKHEDR